MSTALSTYVSRLGWVAAVIIVALGSAGLVTALNHRPGGSARAELTWTADQAIRAPLEGIIQDLDAVALDFDALGSRGRAALASLVAADPDGLGRAVASGQSLVQKIGAATGDLRSRLNQLPGTGPGAEGRISADLLARIATVRQTLEFTGGVGEAWATLSAGSTAASRLAVLLAQHDDFSGESVRQGSQGRYLEAVQALDRSDPVLAQARELRDRLANTADTSTLTQWLDRNAAIDAALRRLYSVLAVTDGKVTQEARIAFDEVRAAQAQLPPDTRALVVIMSDLARAGLNQAVIRIEESRGKMAEAIAVLRRAPATESPGPGAPGGARVLRQARLNR